ncbi:hypothetical protein, partial [Lentzea albida]
TVRLWDPVTGQPVGDPLTGHTGRVAAVAAVPLPDGRTLLATASHDATVRLWDPATQAQLKELDVGTPVYAIATWRQDMITVAMSDGVAVLSVGLV